MGFRCEGLATYWNVCISCLRRIDTAYQRPLDSNCLGRNEQLHKLNDSLSFLKLSTHSHGWGKKKPITLKPHSCLLLATKKKNFLNLSVDLTFKKSHWNSVINSWNGMCLAGESGHHTDYFLQLRHSSLIMHVRTLS